MEHFVIPVLITVMNVHQVQFVQVAMQDTLQKMVAVLCHALQIVFYVPQLAAVQLVIVAFIFQVGNA
jgi:hypothetical protein